MAQTPTLGVLPMNAAQNVALRTVSLDPNPPCVARTPAARLRLSMRPLRLDGHGPRCIWLSARKPVYRALDLQVWIAEHARETASQSHKPASRA
jgi:hypothetical protein